MKNLFYLFISLLLTVYACSSSDDGQEKKSEKPISSVIPLTESTSTIPNALFTDPQKVKNGEESSIISDRLINYINAVPEDASIYVSIYLFEYKPIINALKNAHDRGIKLNIMMDMSDRSHNYPTLNKMGYWGDDIQLVQVKSDAGPDAINHNKFVLFSEVTTDDKDLKNIVFQTSQNFKRNSLVKIQDAVILSNNELYEAYLNYWHKMEKLSLSGMKNYTYSEFNGSNGDIAAYFYPKRKNGSHYGGDTFIELLNNITDPSETTIKIGMSDWSIARISILNKLRDLQSKGATVEIITKNSKKDPKLMDGLKELKEAGGYVKVFNLKKAIDVPKINIHMKVMLIDGNYKNAHHKLIITGTQNLSYNAIWNSNELTLILTDSELFAKYEAYFPKLKLLPGLKDFSN